MTTDTRTFRVTPPPLAAPDRQAEVDAAVATAQTAIDAARQVVAHNGRIGLRQLAAMLAGELEETRVQVARCYQSGRATYPVGQEG